MKTPPKKQKKKKRFFFVDGVYKILTCTNCGQKESSPDYEQMVIKIWIYGNECCNKLEKLENDEGLKLL